MTLRGYGLNVKQTMSYESDMCATDGWIGKLIRTIKEEEKDRVRDINRSAVMDRSFGKSRTLFTFMR